MNKIINLIEDIIIWEDNYKNFDHKCPLCGCQLIWSNDFDITYSKVDSNLTINSFYDCPCCLKLIIFQH